MVSDGGGTVAQANDNQWIERRGGREVTVTDHPVRGERVEFFNEPEDPETGPVTLRFTIDPGHEVGEHAHPEQTETIAITEGEIEATIDGETQRLAVGDTVRIEPGIAHGYRPVGSEAAVLSVSMTPALSFKEFILAEHALEASAYPESGVNLPYAGLVARRYGPMIAPPGSRLQLRVLVPVLALVARLRGYRIPDEPLPVRE